LAEPFIWRVDHGSIFFRGDVMGTFFDWLLIAAGILLLWKVFKWAKARFKLHQARRHIRQLISACHSLLEELKIFERNFLKAQDLEARVARGYLDRFESELGHLKLTIDQINFNDTSVIYFWRSVHNNPNILKDTYREGVTVLFKLKNVQHSREVANRPNYKVKPGEAKNTWTSNQRDANTRPPVETPEPEAPTAPWEPLLPRPVFRPIEEEKPPPKKWSPPKKYPQGYPGMGWERYGNDKCSQPGCGLPLKGGICFEHKDNWQSK
jgi:hypothetical protein